MYRVESLDVRGSAMPTLVFEPEGEGPHPALVIAQHLPVAHAGLEKAPFTIDVGERYAAAGYVCAIPYAFHRYDGAGHGFQDSTNPGRYRPEQSEDAWKKAIAFLDTHLKG